MNQKGIFKQNLNVNNGWIMCNSKSFPGKCYYFNVHTGEAAWNDLDKTKFMAQNYNVPEPNKYYPYPEPSSPPMCMPFQPYAGVRFQNHMTPPRFGNSSFRNYLPMDNPFMQPNVNAWNQRNQHLSEPFYTNAVQKVVPADSSDCKLMVHMTSVPMNKRIINYRFPFKINVREPNHTKQNINVVSQKQNNLECNGNDTGKVRFIRKFGPKTNVFETQIDDENGKFNQHFEPIDPEKDNPVIVRKTDQTKLKTVGTTTNSLCKCPIIQTNGETGNNQRLLGFNNEQQDKFNHEMHKTQSDKLSNHGFDEPYMNHESVHMDYNHGLQKENEYDEVLDQTESFQELTGFNQEVEHLDKIELKKKSLKRGLFSPEQGFEGQTKENDKNEGNHDIYESADNLSATDLRLILMAKRKKVSEPIKEKSKETEIVSTTNTVEIANPPKKKVSFYLNNLKEDFDKEYDQDHYTENFKEDSFSLSQLKSTDVENGEIYFVISAIDILMEEWTILEALLNSDNSYKLLLPNSVIKDLDKICVGDCRGRQNVMRGRQVTRLIALAGDKVVKEEHFGPAKLLEDDSITGLCLKTYDEGYQVILLTKDPEFELKAKENYITYFSIEEIKTFLAEEKQTITFDTNFTKEKEILYENNESVLSPILDSRLLKQNKLSKSSSPILECKSPKRLPKTPKISHIKVTKANSLIQEKITQNENSQKHDLKQSNLLCVQEEVTKNNNNNQKTSILDELMPLMLNKQKYTIPKKTNTKIAPSSPKLEMCNETKFTIPKKSKTNEVIDDLEYSPKEIVTHNVNKVGLTEKVKIEEDLKRFEIKNDTMDERLQSRRDEWICRFTQIMENALTSVLQENGTNMFELPPPWTLLEAVHCVKVKFCSESKVMYLAEKLSNLLFQYDCKGAIIADIKVGELMRIFGFGVLLIGALMTMPQYSEMLKEPDCNLKEMLKNIEDPTTDPNIKLFKYSITTSFDDDEIILDERKKVMNTAEVRRYLCRHYPHLKEYQDEKDELDLNENQNKEKPGEIKILRTLGRNVGSLKISSENLMSMDKQKDKFTPHEYETGNTFGNSAEKNNDTKVVRKINVIKEFEERICSKELDMDLLDYEDHDRTPDLVIDEDVCDVIDDVLLSDDEQKIGEENLRSSVDPYNNNDIDNDNNDTSDSGIKLSEESGRVESVVKIYLNEIKISFLSIYNFIRTSASLLHGELSLKKRQSLEKRAEWGQEHIDEIIDKMKRIISREGSDYERSVKCILARAGAAPDAKTHRYRQVLTKCLEQAEVLRSALKHLKSLLNEDYEKIAEDIHKLSEVPYYNIFE